MKVLGLRTKRKKSVLSPLQRTTYLGGSVGFDHDAGTFVPCSDRVDPRGSQESERRPVTHCQAVSEAAGLMAAASNVMPIGLLYMRPLQWWLKTKGFSPRGNPLRMIKVTLPLPTCLRHVETPWFLSQGPVLGAPYRRVRERRTHPSPVWGPAVCGEVISLGTSTGSRCWPCFQALKYFLPDLRGHQVLVAPTTQRWSLISTTKEVWGRVTCTGWRTRSLCGPRANSSHSEQFTYLGISTWGQTPCRDRGLCPGNGCFTPRWWSRYGARLRWTSSLLRRQRNVPLYSLLHPAPLGLDAMVQTWPRLRL